MSEAKQTVLVFDPDYGGHHLNYVGLVVDGFHERRWSVRFASGPKTFASEEYQAILKSREDIFQPVPLLRSPTHGGLRGRTERSWPLFSAMRRQRPDLVFIPYLDSLFYVFGPSAVLLRGLGVKFPPMDGILFTNEFAHKDLGGSWSTAVKERLCRFILRRGLFRQVFLPDEVAHQSLSASRPRTRLRRCPDPVEPPPAADRQAVRRRLGLPPEASVLGAFGLLNEGKAIGQLAEAFLKARRTPSEFLLLMGRQSRGVRARIESVRGNSSQIVVVDRFVSDAELQDALSAVDVVAVTYPRHGGSASFLIRAAAAGKPVLASDTGWIGHVTRRYQLGATCNPLSEESLQAGIRWALSKPALDKTRSRDFVTMNTVERFKAAVTSPPTAAGDGESPRPAGSD